MQTGRAEAHHPRPRPQRRSSPRLGEPALRRLEPRRQRLSTFLNDLRREDWVKEGAEPASAGLTLAGVDMSNVVLAAIGGAISGFFAAVLGVAEAILGLLLTGSGAAIFFLLRAGSLGAEALERFFAQGMPGAGIVSTHIAERERRLHAVIGGRPPLLRVTESTGHAVKIGVAAIVAAVLLGAFLGVAVFLEPATATAP